MLVNPISEFSDGHSDILFFTLRTCDEVDDVTRRTRGRKPEGIRPFGGGAGEVAAAVQVEACAAIAYPAHTC